MRANFVLSGVASGIRRNLLMTIALVLITAVSLTALGASFLTSVEIDKFRARYENKINVSIYLCSETGTDSGCASVISDAQRAALESKLRADPAISTVTYVSEQQALDNAKATQPADVAQFLKVGDLPASYVVTLHDLNRDFASFSRTYAAQPGVKQVQNADEGFKTLLNLIDSGRVLTIITAIVVLICSVLLMAITIQVSAAQRRNETGIMRLVGASRWMTELPFMIEAVIAAVVGGLVAFGGLVLGKHAILNVVLRGPVQRQVLPDLQLNDIVIWGGASLGIGVVLAAITAFATLRLYVRL